VVKTTYESAPQIRDLRKEAVNRFVPDVVRKKQQAAKGGPAGRLLEPEEMDRLEAEGYLGRTDPDAQESAGTREDEEKLRKLAEEEARFLRELEMQDQDTASPMDDKVRLEFETVQKPRRYVEIEEVEDEDA
jgi:hypothetical protein